MAINRKQIPICRDHHERYHNGTLTAAEISDFRRAAATKQKLVITKLEVDTNVKDWKVIADMTTTSREENFTSYLNSSINSEHELKPRLLSTEYFGSKKE